MTFHLSSEFALHSLSVDTFRSAPTSLKLIEIHSIEQAKHYFSERLTAKLNFSPFLILGSGSNTLFVEDFSGDVLLNKIKGLEIVEKGDCWLVHAAAGEIWHNFVEWTLKKGMYGFENLALIPGTVGAAPIQNIGAYGVELKAHCIYVDVLNLSSLEVERIDAADCQFAYRDSVFKSTHKQGYMIVAVGFAFPKIWEPVVNYGELKALAASNHGRQLTAQQIFDAVTEIRKQKLPDPTKMGNAGSFFKNPVISKRQLDKLVEDYPNMPFYLQELAMTANKEKEVVTETGDDVSNYAKLAAGWLIEQAGLKGFKLGKAAVHQNQALVIINSGGATGKEIAMLAKYIQEKVLAKFNVELEPEVRFIGLQGEVSAKEYLSSLELTLP